MKITRSVREEISEKQWILVDAKDQILGRLSANIAMVLRGKKKPEFTPNADNGDFVVVINAEKVKVTGKKASVKTYTHYTGHPGGLRTKKFSELLADNPEEIIFHAVKGMLPKTKLGRQIITKLKIYAGASHPHEAQAPKLVTLN